MKNCFLSICWLALLVSAVVASSECKSDDECLSDDTCVYGRCAATGCMRRELKDFGSLFDGNMYVNGLLQESGVTKQDLLEARRDHWNDDFGFANAIPVRRFTDTIREHADELSQVAEIITYCRSGVHTRERMLEEGTEGERPLGRGIGLAMGYIFQSVTNILNGIAGVTPEGEAQGEQVEPSASPSVSAVPSVTPSIAPSRIPSASPSMGPTYTVAQKTYLGLHLEGGFVFDGSYSLLFPADNTTTGAADPTQYGRGCLGAGIGGGAELSLIVMNAQLRENNDVLGASVIAEFFEFAFGLALGFGIGVFLEGPATRDGNEAVHYEVTIGGGFGVELVGGSLCRTEACEDAA